MHKTIRHIYLLMSLLFPTLCSAQISWNDFVEDYIFNNEENGNQTELIYEQLNELRQHPIDLNTATEEQLLQIPVITEEQADDIITYRDTYYPMRSTGELMFIKSLNKETREILQLFCYAGEVQTKKSVTLKKLLAFGKHEVYTRSDIPLYTKEGQRDGSYRGSRIPIRLRYTFQSMSHVYAGIQTKKDAGERGFDYLSAYLMLKDMKTGKNSKIREIIIGNYRASFGLGLAINTAISYGKNMQANPLAGIDRGFSRHSSFVESNYLSGGAIRYQYKRMTVSAFGAFNKLDGNYNSDSTGITSIKTDGLHRTALEYSKRHNMEETNIGGNLHFDIGRLKLSTTAVFTHYSIPLTPKWNTPNTLYNKYAASGTDIENYSIAFSYAVGKLKFVGESALSHTNTQQTGFATLNGIQFKPNRNNNLQMLFRHYGAKHTAIHAHAFSENSSPQNEQAVYLSWTSTLNSALDIYTYIDLMRFPWLKSGVSSPSYGIDYMAQATYCPSEKQRWLLRYHIKTKQKDYTNDGNTTLHFNTRQTMKLQHSIQAHERLHLTTTANAICITFAENPAEIGFSISENARWTAIRDLLKFNFALTYVDTDTYNARIYNYEPSLLYSFGINSYYYQALRGIITANITPLKGLNISIRYSMTQYLDHNTIGTGTEEIASSFRSDLQLQLRYTF